MADLKGGSRVIGNFYVTNEVSAATLTGDLTITVGLKQMNGLTQQRS